MFAFELGLFVGNIEHRIVGILRSVAMKNWEAVWLVLKTATPMSIGNILLTVEWELLAIFAAHLGGSQVAAWGIVGTIWGILEYATDCVAAAGEIRVAKLLGNGNPRQAKLSAYKCLFLGSFFAALMSIGFLIAMPAIPGWFTDDENLQSLISSVLPYCAVGNLSLTLGSLAWTLVGAQGRYAVATFHGCIGSLLVTIPCACVSIFYLNWGLPALAASVVVGYMTSGAFNVVTLLLSDWEYIAYRVMIRNGATEPVEEDDDCFSRWNVFTFMSEKDDDNFIDDHDSHRSKNSKLNKHVRLSYVYSASLTNLAISSFPYLKFWLIHSMIQNQ
jgi:Na+-driven multidrug efflux pump